MNLQIKYNAAGHLFGNKKNGNTKQFHIIDLQNQQVANIE